MKRLGFLLIAVTLVAAACGESDRAADDTTSTTAPPVTTTTTTLPATSTSTTTAPTTTTTVPAEPQFVNVYFMIDSVGSEAGPFVGPVTREIDPTVAVARAALEALIEGPTAGELAGTPAITGGLPAGTELLGLTIADGTARADFSAEVESIGGTFGEMSVLTQIVFTLTQFPTVDDVVIMIDGEAVELFGGHGMEIAPSLDRDALLGWGLVPEILIDQPAWFASSESPLLVSGIGRLFEATAQWALYDNDGLQLAEGFTTASTGGPDWGTFQFAIPYEVDALQLGSLMMWEESAKDGSQMHLVEHPVWLNP
ncbi:MAG: GerMN domain-containing protein [Acidimicrobiia bacterium]